MVRDVSQLPIVYIIIEQIYFIIYDIQYVTNGTFLSDPGVPGVRSMGPDVRPSARPSVSTTLCADLTDLTDVTLADEDSNSIQTDDVNKRCSQN